MSEGYRVYGVTAAFHTDDATAQAIEDAREVCRFLGIDHVVYEAQGLFDQEVIQPFCSMCAEGSTPSPCVFCNRFCKIPLLERAALDLGCEYVATGHYARVVTLPDCGRYALKTALDHSKDQSYMLSLLTQEQLSKLVLPLGGYTKTEIRFHAESLGIPVAHRPDSQDLCFIKDDYRDFLLSRGVEDKPGVIVTKDGRVVGEHQGLHRYTLGQRKGLGVALGEPCFVLEKNTQDNTLVIGFKEDSYLSSVTVSGMNWIAFDTAPQLFECSVKIRYRSEPVPCSVRHDGNNTIRIDFHSPQSLTATGQYAVCYQGDLLLGGGMISAVEFA